MSNAPGAILATLLIASVATAAERTMVHEAVVEAPIADVWAAFTTKQGVESWMVPLAEVDLRVGGTLRTSYNPDGRIGDETTIVHRILSYEPQRMLSMKVEQSPSGFAHDVVESTWGVIQLEPLAPDRTRVRVAGMGWQEGEQWDEAWAFFEAGNAYTLRALQERFAADADQNGTGIRRDLVHRP